VIFVEMCENFEIRLSNHYFKPHFLIPYIEMATEKCSNVLIKYFSITSKMRAKVPTNEKKTADNFENAIKDICKRPKLKKDVHVVAEEALSIIKEDCFKQSLKIPSAIEQEKKRQEHENMIKETEKEERDMAKKKEIEGLVMQARYEYMQKVNNTMHTKVKQRIKTVASK
jgi:hypothetical protein